MVNNNTKFDIQIIKTQLGDNKTPRSIIHQGY